MIRKILFFLLCLFRIGVHAWGQERNYAFAFEPTVSLLYGRSFELLYTGSGSNDYRSELRWDLDRIFLAGCRFSVMPREPGAKSAFFATVYAAAGIVQKDGTMEDRDWLEPSTVPGSLTLYSKHTNKAGMLFADIEGGMILPLTGNFNLRLALAFSYMYFDFEAWDGYIQYGTNNHMPGASNPYIPWNPAWSKDPVSGKGIGYTQHWFIPAPQIGFDWRPGRAVFSLSFSLSPLVWCMAEDNHYLRRPAFSTHETLMDGLAFEPKGAAVFKVSDRWGLGLNLNGRYITRVRGNYTQMEHYSSGTVTAAFKDIAGAGIWFVSFGVSLRYTV